jgi:hypothetical protein
MEAFIAVKFNDLIQNIVGRLDSKPSRVIAVIPGNLLRRTADCPACLADSSAKSGLQHGPVWHPILGSRR